jgi:hypothetical protein
MRIQQTTATEEEGGVGTQTLEEELASTPETLFIEPPSSLYLQDIHSHMQGEQPSRQVVQSERPK